MNHFHMKVLPEAWLEKLAEGQGTFLIRNICINVFIVDRNSHKYAKGERNPSGNTHCQPSKNHNMENYELTTNLASLEHDLSEFFNTSLCL